MDDDARLRTSRRLAIAAFLLAVTSLWLAWWRITWTSGDTSVRDDVRLFRPEDPLTTSWGPWVTGILVVAVVGLLFVRIAARSDKHEPASWRRDLGGAAAILVGALVSCLCWPADVPAFWGGRTYMVENVTTRVHEVAMPALGWWVALVGAVLLLVGRLMARPVPTTQK